MRNVNTLYYFLLLIVTMACISPQEVQAQRSQEVLLAGYKMEPRVGTSGSGFLTVERSGDTLRVHGEFSELISPFYGAYIMGEIRGQSGNVMYSLKAKLSENEKSGVFKKEPNTFVLSEGQKEMLKNGNLYLTIASRKYKRGEIRGQIPPSLGG